MTDGDMSWRSSGDEVVVGPRNKQQQRCSDFAVRQCRFEMRLAAAVS